MNIAECNILMELQRSGYTSQRALARAVGHSLGVVNRSLKALHEAGYIDDGCRPTERPRRNSGPGSRGRRLSWRPGPACE